MKTMGEVVAADTWRNYHNNHLEGCHKPWETSVSI